MEWIDDLNDVMTYIEKHLTDEISYDELAKLAHCSTYHFQRMFSYIAGVPLSEYIRRRRMSLAAVDLQTTDMKVIDIALKYGYNSPTAFNRAFKNIHHISPSETRNNVVVLSSFPPLEFTLSIKGVEKMNYVLLVFQKRYLKLLKKTLKSCQKFGISLLVKESLLN